MIIQTEDGEIEVAISDIQSLGDEEDPTDIPGVQDRINSVAGKTRKEAQKSTRNQLLESDDFWRKAASKRGVELRDSDLRPKGASAGETAKLRERVDALKDKARLADELQDQVQAGRRERLKNQLLQKAGNVKDDLKDVFLDHTADRFGYDGDDDVHVPLGEDGQLDFTRTLDDVIHSVRKEKPSLFKSQGATSTGTQPSSSGGSTRTYTEQEVSRLMNQASSLSNEEYRNVMDAVQSGRVVKD